MSKNYGSEGVVERRLVFCERLQRFETDELIETCERCGRFFLYCCHCSMQQRSNYPEDGVICHSLCLVFTDGACKNNGYSEATAGIGVAYGLTPKSKISIPITSDIDPSQRRTSQRAELLAAIEGLDCMLENYYQEHHPEVKKRKKKDARKPAIIIVTDSEYVVKGMTDWLPAWKDNSFRTSRNTKPANLDLFRRLDKRVTEGEAKYDIDIGFWHVPREYNQLADSLAKNAAEEAFLGS